MGRRGFGQRYQRRVSLVTFRYMSCKLTLHNSQDKLLNASQTEQFSEERWHWTADFFGIPPTNTNPHQRYPVPGLNCPLYAY